MDIRQVFEAISNAYMKAAEESDAILRRAMINGVAHTVVGLVKLAPEQEAAALLEAWGTLTGRELRVRCFE